MSNIQGYVSGTLRESGELLFGTVLGNVFHTIELKPSEVSRTFFVDEFNPISTEHGMAQFLPLTQKQADEVETSISGHHKIRRAADVAQRIQNLALRLQITRDADELNEVIQEINAVSAEAQTAYRQYNETVANLMVRKSST